MKTIEQILKIKAVVLYILKAFPEGVDYIHLFKVMYFAQQDQLKEYGLPIIYDTFVARKHGPVPAAVVLYILKAFPEGVDYIHLFKVMYFAQQDQLKEYGLPIIYDTFVARKHGPVPALTYKVLRGIEGKADLSTPELKDFADSLNIAISQDGHQLVLASKNAECDMDELSVADVKMLNKWIEKCKDVESFDLSDKSHEDRDSLNIAISQDGHQLVLASKNAECDMDELSVADVKMLNKWIEKCKDVESFDLSDKSHEDRAWKRAKRQADKTGEDSKITMYDMAAAAGASKDMLCVIRDRQSVQKALSWI